MATAAVMDMAAAAVMDMAAAAVAAGDIAAAAMTARDIAAAAMTARDVAAAAMTAAMLTQIRALTTSGDRQQKHHSVHHAPPATNIKSSFPSLRDVIGARSGTRHADSSCDINREGGCRSWPILVVEELLLYAD